MTDQLLERVRTALADRYVVEAELGRGGMATVYLARDPKHDRAVAIKVLYPELAASLGAERFLREIQITAKLSHPHILPLYDSGAAGELLYYVMPRIEGETLADMMKREGQLSIKEAVQIAAEVAGALAHAHSYGLVHRDIKPSNIMLSSGHAVVADFGIARAVSAAGGEKITQTGMAVGTPAYMSPEQAAGDDQVDGRSDIYSLGCVLYEMVVGQIPFTGPTPQAIMARHSMDQVPPPHIMRNTIPADLEEIILQSLAKTPADRFRTAGELAEALDAVDTTTAVHRRPAAAARPVRRTSWVPIAAAAALVVALVAVGWVILDGRGEAAGGVVAAGGLDPRRIAVLYFDDLSADGELRHVADGLTEELIEQLSRVRALEVISRNGVAPYRAGDVTRDSIARALEAGTLIEGSVEPVGDRLRVTTRLVEGGSGADFERASFTLPAGQLLTVVDSAAQDIARLLRRRLGEEIELRERRAAIDNATAWVLLQRAERARKDAEQRIAHHDTEGALALLDQADSLFATAAAAAPAWPEPVLQRGWTAYRGAVFLQREPLRAATWAQRAKTYSQRALDLARSHPRAFELRGTAAYFEYLTNVTPDASVREQLLTQARTDLERAVSIDPGLATAHAMLSHLYHRFDDVVSATLAAQRAYEADEFLSNADDVLDRLFRGSYDLAQFREAQRWCNEGVQRFPDDFRFTECQMLMLIAPDAEPDVERAWRLAAQLDSLAPAHVAPARENLGRMFVGGVLGRAGLLDSARSVLQGARTGDTDADPHQDLPGWEAIMRGLIGDTAQAMALLKRYVATHPDHSFERGGNIHWWWLPLRDHPEFRQVVEASR